MAHREAPEIRVYLDGVHRDDAALLSVGAYTGSRPLNYATIQIKQPVAFAPTTFIPPLGHARASIFQRTSLMDLFRNALCEVEITGRFDVVEHVHFGRVSAIQPQFSSDGEILLLQSRADDHLFGGAIEGALVGQRQLSAADDSTITEYRPAFLLGMGAHFNPVVDGKATPNQSLALFGQANIFIDPRSVNAETLNGDRIIAEDPSSTSTPAVATFWTLATAVNYLCWSLNASQTYFRNPSIADLVRVFGTSRAQLRNTRIALGTYLPEALDRLLLPHGFGWRVRIHARGDRRIEFYERGAGEPSRALSLQHFGGTVNVNFDNVEALNGTFDMTSNTFNRVQLLGGHPEIEVSILLRPAWNETYDAETSAQAFSMNAPGWKTDEQLQKAWRKFAANEGGTYTGKRPWWDEALDLSVLWPSTFTTIPRRRQILPVISEDESGASLGRHQGVFLEYWDPYTGTNGDWLPIDQLQGGAFQIVEGEIAVVFTGTEIPNKLFAIGADAAQGIDRVALRLTCAISSDDREAAVVDESGLGPLVDARAQVIDLRNDYRVRTIDDESPVATLDNGTGASVPLGGTALSLGTAPWPLPYTTDGSSAILDKADELIDRYNSGTFEGSVTVEGIDRNLTPQLGRPVWGINLRGFEFRTTSPSKRARYPMIVGVEMDVQSQKTRVRLETLRHA